MSPSQLKVEGECDRDREVLDRHAITNQVQTQDFAWRVPNETDACKVLLIKEQSLQQGLQHCKNLITVLEAGFENITKHSQQSAEAMWPSESRKDWINQSREIMEDHEAFRVLVGVAGATGSGKTSALNALLGFRELLPTNNEEAATAVMCKVAYNNDSRPEYAFRCRVTFQSKESLEIRLKKFFVDLESRNELESCHDGSAEDEAALREMESVLQPTREMISIIFGLSDDVVAELGYDELLMSNPDAMGLLGTVKEFHEESSEAMSEKMKPYMDSTTADHTMSGASFAAWPLIEQVELFVKSDILRNGVVLVDLPGLGDAVESRALVAQKSFDQLTATLIVAQAPRAADNSTAVDLMSKHQEISMMLDGKFHKQTFCVCLSQIDQIDRKAALRKPDAKANSELQAWLDEEAGCKITLKSKLQELKRHKKTMTKLRNTLTKSRRTSSKRAVDQTAAKNIEQNIKSEKRVKKLEIAQLSHDVGESKRRLKELDGAITFACIQARNKFLEDRIEHDFEKRQARIMSKDSRDMESYDGHVAVCPTSAKAFWKCKSAINRMTGFPTEAYTGIPSLASWIRSASIPKREEHVDDLLTRLHAQYNTIQLWSKDKSKLKDTLMTKDFFEKQVLAEAMETMKQNLTASWSHLTAEVVKLNPLSNKTTVLDECPGLCAQVVRNWAYRKPDDKASDDKLHWLTYQANLNRSGDKFVSRSKTQRQEYNWMQDISHILYKKVVKDWNKSLNHDIPSLTVHYVSPSLDQIWDDFTTNLYKRISSTEPRLLTDFMNETGNLETIKKKTKNLVRRALKRVSTRASQAHPLVVDKFRSEWEETFQQALAIKGNGCYKNRQQVLLAFAAEESQKTFKTSLDFLQAQLQKSFDMLPDELEVIADSAIKDLRRHVNVLLHKVLQPQDLHKKLKVVIDEEQALKKSIEDTLESLTSHWQHPVVGGDVCPYDTNQQIPEDYEYVKTELEELEDDDCEIDSASVSEDDESSDTEKFSEGDGP